MIEFRDRIAKEKGIEMLEYINQDGVKGQTLRKQYKEKISDYRNWDQLEHAHDYLLYPENIGENLSLCVVT